MNGTEKDHGIVTDEPRGSDGQEVFEEVPLEEKANADEQGKESVKRNGSALRGGGNPSRNASPIGDESSNRDDNKPKREFGCQITWHQGAYRHGQMQMWTCRR